MCAYNVRLFDYEHSQQIRIYTKTVNEQNEIENKHNKIKRKESIENEKNNAESTENLPCDKDNFLQSETDTLRSQKVSVNRTKQSIYEITRSNTWDWFVTLTFDRNKIDSSDYDLLLKKTRKWLNHVKNRKCPDMKYIIVPELHSDGIHYHFHGLFANCDGLEMEYSGVKQNGKKVYNILDFKYGFSTATKVQDTKKVSSYISKYITKDLENHIKGKRRYIASNNCKKAQIVDYLMTEDDIKTLIECVSDNITHMKTQDIPLAQQRIKYIELSK